MSQAKLATSFITQSQEENHMPVDPQVQAYLDRVATLNMSPLSSLTPEAARRQVVESLTLFEDEEGEAVARVENRTIPRSEEHTSELQSRFDLVCRLLL